MFVVGLTGGIATGKSTVAAEFATLGAEVIDTDVIAREVVKPGSEGLQAVVDAFGTEVLDADGSLDRGRLRRHIFADAQARARLEAIVHPRIEARVSERLAASHAPYVVLVVPLLVESGWDRLVDRVLVVDVDEATQIQRLQARDGSPEADARAALAAQADRDTRLARADDVIDNRSSLTALRSAIDRLHERYLALASARHD